MKTNALPTAFEVADKESWFKSSYSGDNGGGGCVLVALLGGLVGVRDSKHTNGPAFVIRAPAWSSFIREVRSPGSRAGSMLDG